MVKRVKKSKKSTLPPIHCKGCTINFVPRDHRQHFHSDTCREEYYQRTYYSKETTRKVCPNCGIKFSTSKPRRQIYCKPECREEAKVKRREGIYASVTAERITFLGDRFAAIERDNFKCVYCGKGVPNGVKLDVEDDGKGNLRTVCDMCVEGREFNKEKDEEPKTEQE